MIAFMSYTGRLKLVIAEGNILKMLKLMLNITVELHWLEQAWDHEN